MNQAEDLAVRAVPAGEAAELRSFLDHAASATLFHEPSFLAYHPEGRFAFHPLAVVRGGRIVAYLPGGIAAQDGRPVFRSPLGASFGGSVLAARTSAADTLALLRCLQDHAQREGWSGIDLTPPPSIYRRDGSDTLGFGLHASGFTLASRMLCAALHLHGTAPRFPSLYRSRNVTKTRAAQRLGVETTIGGSELLEAFQVVFDATYERHGVAATHSMAELRDLMQRLPDRFQIVLARHQGRPVAGLFLMRMSEAVSNAFYICSSSEDAEINAGLAMFAWVMDHLGDSGTQTLDLGPASMPDGSLNRGVCFFKEGLGAFGYCRDRWVWNAT